MKQRLEMGYILPGQMNELFGYKEIMGRLEKYSCCAVSALDIKTCGLKSNGQFGIHVKSVSAYNNSFELLIADLKKYKKTDTVLFYFRVPAHARSVWRRIF